MSRCGERVEGNMAPLVAGDLRKGFAMELRIADLPSLNFENQKSTIGNLHSRPTATAIGFPLETWRN